MNSHNATYLWYIFIYRFKYSELKPYALLVNKFNVGFHSPHNYIIMQ